MGPRIRTQLLITILAMQACGSPGTKLYSQAATESSKAKDATPEGDAASAPSVVNEKPKAHGQTIAVETGQTIDAQPVQTIEAEPVQAIAAEPAPTTNAAEPVPIGGAFLTCNPSATAGSVGCEIFKAEGQATKVEPSLKMEWSILPSDATSPIPVNAPDIIPDSSSSLFIVKLQNVHAGKIKVKISDESSSSQTLDFAIESLPPVADTTETFATAFATLPTPLFLTNRGIREGHFFGPGPIAGCSAAQTAAADVHTIRFNLKNQVTQGGLFLANVCGLQTAKAKATIVMPAPFKPITVTLVPGAHLALVSNLTLVPGDYKITIDNSQNLLGSGEPNGFVFTSVAFYGIGDNAATEFNANYQDSFSE